MRTNDVLFDRFESESVERASWFESCIQYAQLCMLCHRLGLKEPQTDTASLHFVYMSPFSFLSPFSFHACLSWDFVCLFFVIFVIFFVRDIALPCVCTCVGAKLLTALFSLNSFVRVSGKKSLMITLRTCSCDHGQEP